MGVVVWGSGGVGEWCDAGLFVHALCALCVHVSYTDM